MEGNRLNAEKEDILIEPMHQKSWMMWLLLIIFPPLGVIFVWIQKKFSKVKKLILTIVAGVYFIFPIIMLIALWNPITPLYQSHDDFVDVFNQEVSKQVLPYQMQITEEDTSLISSELTEEITLIENLDKSGNVQELIMIGQGAGTDIIHIMGILIEITNPELEKQEVGKTLKELRLFENDYQFNSNESTVENDQIRYHLKYDEEIGVIFSVSNIN